MKKALRNIVCLTTFGLSALGLIGCGSIEYGADKYSCRCRLRGEEVKEIRAVNENKWVELYYWSDGSIGIQYKNMPREEALKALEACEKEYYNKYFHTKK